MYLCNKCGRDFKSSQSLNAHKRSHTNYKPVLKIKNKVKQILKKCKNCETPVTRTKNIFCSKSCSTSYNNKMKIKKLHNIKVCMKCYNLYISPGNTCSKSCGARKYDPYTSNLIKKSRNKEACARYYANKKSQTPKNEDLSKIKDFYFNCPDGYEVDHIKPISKGGLHSLSNLQYLTISENRKKSNKWKE